LVNGILASLGVWRRAKRILDLISPNHITFIIFFAVLKLLEERVSVGRGKVSLARGG